MNSSSKVQQITRMAILVAIIFLLSFTPLGYLVIGPIAATTIQMPVIIGAVLMGPAAGGVLGFFFGLSAIIKVLTMPGADPFATLALAHSPFAYLAVCLGAWIWAASARWSWVPPMPPESRRPLSPAWSWRQSARPRKSCLSCSAGWPEPTARVLLSAGEHPFSGGKRAKKNGKHMGRESGSQVPALFPG